MEYRYRMAQKGEKTRSRGWCITVNNYTDDDFKRISGLYEDDVNCKYLVIGFEEADRTGTEHMQVYVYYTNNISWKQAQKRFTPYHFEAQKAKKNVEAYFYSMEDGDFIEYGNRPRQGHRNDIAVCIEDIRQGKSMKQIATEYRHQWVQYRRSFEEYRKLIADYDTKLILYDQSKLTQVLPIVYSMYDPDKDMMDTMGFMTDIAHQYYSRKYRYIFAPSRAGMEEISDIVYRVIDGENQEEDEEDLS